MWSSFAVAVLFALFLLYLPGYFAGRALRLNRVVSLCVAPLLSLLLYNVFALACDAMGVFGSWLTIVLPALILCVVAAGVSRLVVLRKKLNPAGVTLGICAGGSRMEWLQLAAYAVAGVVATCFVFALSLTTADSFLQGFDNAFHMDTIRSFLESGCWSIFDSRFYVRELVGDNAIPWVVSGGSSYYPTSWHLIASGVISAVGSDVTVTINAVNAAITGVVFPVSTFLLMKAIFPGNDRVVWAGSVCAVAFAAFPWDFLTFGPIYPNLLGNVLMPLPMAVFISLFASRQNAGCSLVMRFLLLVVCVISLFLAHSGAILSAVMLLAAYLCHQMAELSAASKLPANGLVKKVTGYAVCALAILGIWTVLYFSSFMQSGPLSDWWPAYSGKLQALKDIVRLALKEPAQYFLAVLVIIGGIRALRRKDQRWLVVTYVVVCGVLFLTASTESLPKRFLAGFWYTDSHRIAAMVAIAGIPLAALGLDGVFWLVLKALDPGKAAPLLSKIARIVYPIGIVCIFAVCNFSPTNLLGGRVDTTPFGFVTTSLRTQTDPAIDNVYNADERAFVQKVQSLVGDDLVINQPNDGSAFARGVDGLNAYYRILRGYGGDDETWQSKTVRTDLCNIATDSEVARAVSEVGAKYVLQLDSGDYAKKTSPYLWTYDDVSLWVGIDQITDTTPGFEVVLAEGDMRLYRITGA